MHPMFDIERRSIPVSAWPEQDRQAWLRACAPLAPFDPHVGQASEWAPGTIEKTRGGYGRWLRWLEFTGELTRDASPGSRATLEAVKAYRRALEEKGNASYTVAGRIQELADALRVMEPEVNWTWIRRGANRLHGGARPERDLARRMRAPDEILQLADDLMHHAEHDRFRTEHERAVMFRDGLLFAVLVFRLLWFLFLSCFCFGFL